MEALPRVSEMYIELLSCLRNELGMETSVGPLKEQFQKNQERMQRSLKSSVDRFQEMLTEHEQEE